MLNLSQQERAQLSSHGALCSDADGNEILTGLTSRESIFVLRYQKIFDDRRSAAHQRSYLQLRQRHATACAAIRDATGEKLMANVELALDQALEYSFPASDPVAISITSIRQEK
ncbi:hypothetical protein GTP44_07905 [Duganella sp. FT50W]|uniref:Uncharacterized protein n=1 Tax=Duganella lactea TaxID=2692173 RepID=A0A6L8MIX5_9BURK|nr:hypothetical protein [Duganella lactea]MYM34431.1 hypothetical protein [Duganella lactea]MYM81882.1 hypothetical protein [Duganella lactea]